MKTKKKVSLIGLGAMGRAIGNLLLRNNIDVDVWNRSPEKARDLVSKGAEQAATVKQLLDQNEVLILSLTDYGAMYNILNGETKGLKGKTIINLSSDTPESARKAEQWAQAHGARFLTGAIMVEPHTLGTPESLVLYSGDSKDFEAYEPILNVFGKSDYLGKDAGLAQLFSLALLNILFMNATAMLQSYALVKSANIKAQDFEPYLKTFISGLNDMMAGTAQEVDTGTYNGEFNSMEMMATAMHHVHTAIHDQGLNTVISNELVKAYDQTLALGHGKSSLTSLIEVLKT